MSFIATVQFAIRVANTVLLKESSTFGYFSLAISCVLIAYGIVKCLFYANYKTENNRVSLEEIPADKKNKERVPLKEIPAEGFLAIIGIVAALPAFQKEINPTGDYMSPAQGGQPCNTNPTDEEIPPNSGENDARSLADVDADADDRGSSLESTNDAISLAHVYGRVDHRESQESDTDSYVTVDNISPRTRL